MQTKHTYMDHTFDTYVRYHSLRQTCRFVRTYIIVIQLYLDIINDCQISNIDIGRTADDSFQPFLSV